MLLVAETVSRRSSLWHHLDIRLLRNIFQCSNAQEPPADERFPAKWRTRCSRAPEPYRSASAAPRTFTIQRCRNTGRFSLDEADAGGGIWSNILQGIHQPCRFLTSTQPRKTAAVARRALNRSHPCSVYLITDVVGGHARCRFVTTRATFCNRRHLNERTGGARSVRRQATYNGDRARHYQQRVA